MINTAAIGASRGPARQSWTVDDAMLYALGIGAGAQDPATELAFTTENSRGITPSVFPTYAVVLASRLREIYSELGDIDFSKVVHGEQRITLHRPLPPAGEVDLTTRIADILDKTSGAVVLLESTGTDPADGEPVFTTQMSLFVRGYGGWGGSRGEPGEPWEVQGDPDHVVRQGTRVDQALLYRLTGDRNPLHSDPEVARAAGFDRPILHGLCTLGFVGRALLATYSDLDPARFQSMSTRFSAPVYPGQQIVTRMWDHGSGEALFDVTNADGGVVLSHGRFTYRTE